MDNITSVEIKNQFTTWPKVKDIIDKHYMLRYEIDEFVDDETSIIFTGAGTSGYIGDLLVPYLNEGKPVNKYSSVYTTNIVANPELYLKNKKVLLVSFARSGNSPESLETISLVDRFAKDCKHVIISCNSEGELARVYYEYTIVLPEETNDQGFAMTNSYSTMLLTAAKLFGLSVNLDMLVYEAKRLYSNFPYERVLDYDFENIVYLSNGENVGLLNELKLKFMELTNGKFGYYSDQFLNFRHGPKSVITKKSLVIMLCSGDEVSNKYQLDLVNELMNDENKPYVVCFGLEGSKSNLDLVVNTVGLTKALSILPLCQNLAVLKSLECGINPDNPSPNGSVNRVVQGVNIHERKKC